MLENISSSFSDTVFVTAQREERTYLKSSTERKWKKSLPLPVSILIESFMTHAVLLKHLILCNMFTLDTLVKGSCSRKLFEYI